MATPATIPVEDEEDEYRGPFGSWIEKMLAERLAGIKGQLEMSPGERNMAAFDATPLGQITRVVPSAIVTRKGLGMAADYGGQAIDGAEAALEPYVGGNFGFDNVKKVASSFFGRDEEPAAAEPAAAEPAAAEPAAEPQDTGEGLLSKLGQRAAGSLLNAGSLAGKAGSLGVAALLKNAQTGGEGGEGGEGAVGARAGSSVAPEVDQKQLATDFEITHGGPFDPKSAMDRAKMEQLAAARAAYPEATPTQLALKIYRGEFD